MKWLEVIHLRSTEHNSEVLDAFLEQLFAEIRKKEDSGIIKLFRRAPLETDVCLQLHHESAQLELAGSRLGIHLAMALKRFGMVNHTVWVPNEHRKHN